MQPHESLFSRKSEGQNRFFTRYCYSLEVPPWGFFNIFQTSALETVGAGFVGVNKNKQLFTKLRWVWRFKMQFVLLIQIYSRIFVIFKKNKKSLTLMAFSDINPCYNSHNFMIMVNTPKFLRLLFYNSFFQEQKQ